MAHKDEPELPTATHPRVRCRCGHFPTHHMVVVPLGTTASFRLESSGPCAICGESTCRRYAPGGS